jgi:HD-GYP domain-containing protein (c-di-GMP phosphodiesterase class II)
METATKTKAALPAVALDATDSFFRELLDIHGQISAALGSDLPFRLVIALYDAESASLHTYAMLGPGGAQLSHYTAKLGDVPSLGFAKSGAPFRVVDDLALFAPARSAHNAAILAMGYRSSYARAVVDGGTLAGIVFVNSTEPGFFTPERRRAVDPFVHMVGLLLKLRTAQQRSVLAALVSAQEIGAYRDTDTALHLRRMAHIARLIAEGIAEKYGLSDAFVDRLFRFAPMHDIGKVAISDAILLKPGKLTAEEFDAIKDHSRIGAKIVAKIVECLDLAEMPGRTILENIVELHHERRDGSGYPHGLAGDAIPIEAQIVAVADVFDALTSRRPYKEPWPVERALAELRRLAPASLNGDCVEALAQALPQAIEIVDKFADR